VFHKKIINFLRLSNKLTLIVIVLGIAIVGTVVLTISHAATSTASIEPETGVTTSCASSVADSQASGGNAIKFGGCSGTGLDSTGATIPDTNYAIPVGAIFMSPSGADANTGTQAAPVKTIARAVALVPAGGTVVLRAGLYRDGSTTSITKSFTLQPYPHEKAWLDGTDVVTTWTSTGAGQWYTSWNTPSFCSGGYYTYPYNAQPTSNGGPCSHYDMYGDPANPAAGDPQMVFIDGVYVHEVTSQAAATGSNFYYNQTTKLLYIGTDPAGHTVELAARPNALVFQGGSGGVSVRGIGITRYATNEYNGNATHGAVLANVPNVTFENDVFTRMAGAALSFANSTGGAVKSSVFAANGDNGLDGNGHFTSTKAVDGLDIEDNVFNGNNTERFGTGCSASCSAAAIKLAHMDGFTLKNNILEGGIGAAKGFWCDLACSNGVMVNNLIRNNGSAGLMYEVSDTGIIASNLIYGNGGEGLKVGAANTAVYNNTSVNNGIAALIYDDSRSYGVNGATDVGPDTVNLDFSNNILSGSGTMVEAWRTSTVVPNTGPNTFFSGLDYNSYYRSTGTAQVLYNWRDVSTTNFMTLSSLTTSKGWESHGQDISSGADPFFVDAAAGDYTVRTTSVAYNASKTLPANVAAALGLSPTTVISRGAVTWAMP
jgi:hypothetical protein